MRTLALSLALAAGLSAAPIQWAGNGHWYEVSTQTATFANARAAALASTFLGAQGYLVTITSAAENAFVFSLTSSAAWAGGSDQAVEGEWRWLDGPEAGALLSYTNWAGGEPNNVGDEDGLQLNRFAPAQTWNDAAAGTSMLYIVEYDTLATPEPASLALVGGSIAILTLLARRRRG